MSGYSKYDGFVFLGAFVVVFVLLKLANVIKWSWLSTVQLMLMCLLFMLFVIFIIVVAYFIYCLIRGIIENVKK